MPIRRAKHIITIAFLLLTSLSGISQNKQDRNFITSITVDEIERERYNVSTTHTHNEGVLLLKGLFVFYKSLISSQDSGNCNFHPSCSVYAMHSVQKKGILFGMLNGFDRLQRCNSLNRKDYPIHPETHLLYDPVE